MKEDIIKYHSNGGIKHKICYHDNDNKYYEQFFDENGRHHRKNGLPDYQSWYENGRLCRKTYIIHGRWYNINNPAYIYFHDNGKINWKDYFFSKEHGRANKLSWMNQIKNI